MCSWHTHSRVVCVSCALYHHVRRGTRCTICAVPCALCHVRCTICAIPFAPYHARCIMWCRRADPRGRARSASAGRSVHGVVHSRSGVMRSLVMCFSHLCFSALYSSHSCGSSFSGRRERGNATGLRRAMCHVDVPWPMPHAPCGRAGGRKTRKSASAESASRHGGSVRFDALPAWVLGSADRHRGSGARARAGGLAAVAASGEARRSTPVYVATCAFLIQNSRSVKSQSSELPRPSKVDLHGSRASTRGSSSVPLRFLSSDHARPVPLRLLSGTHAASRRSLNAVMPSLASSEWKSF